jgi:ribosome biogenesis protein BRX1
MFCFLQIPLIKIFSLSLQIWVRNYQILEEKPETALEAQKLKKQLGAAESTSLVEIGPRFVLEPIRIFRGSFGGQTLYQNPSFVSPNETRAAEKRKQGMTFENRKAAHQMRKEHEASIVVPPNPLDSVFK